MKGGGGGGVVRSKLLLGCFTLSESRPKHEGGKGGVHSYRAWP